MRKLRCAIYTRKSVDEGLDKAFTTLHAQRAACIDFIKSQSEEGWTPLAAPYDDGGFSGANMQRPALQRLLEDVECKRIDVVVVYKMDRLTRSLNDFAKLVEHFDKHGVSFISVTQAFNTSSSVGRLTLNILLTFAQFERELIAERIRDKIAASKQRGIFTGGPPPFGYRLFDRRLFVARGEAKVVKRIYDRFVALGSVRAVIRELQEEGIRKQLYITRGGQKFRSRRWYYSPVRKILSNRVYLGETVHNGKSYPGQHPAIIDRVTFEAAQKTLMRIRERWRHDRTLGASALLTGLIVDETGNCMTPMQSGPGASRRYRSDVRTRRQRGRVISIAATDADSCVLRCINACSPRQLRVSAVDGQDNRRRVRDSVRKVRVCGDGIRVEIRRDARGIDKPNELEDADIRTTRDSIEFFFPKNLIPPAHLRTIEGLGRFVALEVTKPLPLLVSFARAHEWRRMIERSKIRNIEALARESKASPAEVLKVLRLAYLAPEIQKQIVAGNPPSALLAWPNSPDLPLDWYEQRVALGLN